MFLKLLFLLVVFTVTITLGILWIVKTVHDVLVEKERQADAYIRAKACGKIF